MGEGMVTQLTLDMTPAQIVGRKNPDAVRQYLLPAKVNTMTDTLALKLRQPKPVIVADAIMTYGLLVSVMPDMLDAIVSGDLAKLLSLYTKA